MSAAAGSVGSLVAQMAKLRGHTVIGSAGSAEKAAYLLDELRLHAAFDYRSASLPDLLRTAVPDGIDVYFDCVGGDHLEAALGALRRGGRVAICGSISEYDAAEPPPGPRNLFLAVANDLTLRGFRVELRRPDGGDARGAGRLGTRRPGHLPGDGGEGLENAPMALASLMRGDTIGKTLVRIPRGRGRGRGRRSS